MIYGRAREGGGALASPVAAAASISMVGVWAGGARRPSGRGKMRQSASVDWVRGGQEGHTGGCACCPGRLILSSNPRPKWVRADAFGPLYLFESSRWAECFVRANTFRRAMVVWVGPLEMSSLPKIDSVPCPGRLDRRSCVLLQEYPSIFG
jgi:hypothetical protein